MITLQVLDHLLQLIRHRCRNLRMLLKSLLIPRQSLVGLALLARTITLNTEAAAINAKRRKMSPLFPLVKEREEDRSVEVPNLTKWLLKVKKLLE
jgi:hypothetical protein